MVGQTDPPAAMELLDSNPVNRDSKQPASQHCSRNRIWMILSLLFLATTVALLGYVIHIKLAERGRERSREELAIQRFPGYFRTAEEQALVEKQYFSLANVTYEVDFINGTQLDTCTFSCSRYNTVTRKRRQVFVHQPLMEFVRIYSVMHSIQKRNAIIANTVNHGCCMSRIKYIDPVEAVDLYGNNVTVAQFDHVRQYFPTEECKQATGCTGCGCSLQATMFSAVVEDGDNDIAIGRIVLPGCCKCINGLSPKRRNSF